MKHLPKTVFAACVACSAAVLLGSCALSGQTPPVNAILTRIDDHYNRLHSLAAGYTEHYAGMGLDRTESGTLLLKKPGRMRWNYTAPVGKVFILDGRFAWFYTPGDSQATRIPAKDLDDMRSPLRFLLGHTHLQNELKDLSVTTDGAGYRVSGIPRAMAQRVKLLTLCVTSQGAIESMRAEEIDGTVTEFSFRELREDVSIQDSTFRFTPPSGVATVDGLAPF